MRIGNEISFGADRLRDRRHCKEFQTQWPTINDRRRAEVSGEIADRAFSLLLFWCSLSLSASDAARRERDRLGTREKHDAARMPWHDDVEPERFKQNQRDNSKTAEHGGLNLTLTIRRRNIPDPLPCR